MNQWLVGITKPNREKWAAQNIRRQGFDYYLPLIEPRARVVSGAGARHMAVARPLFPRYIFVFSADGRWRSLLGTYGLSGLVMEGNQPAVMPADQVAALRAREDAGGFVQLPPALKVGDEIEISHGAFAGHRGIYEGTAAHDRVRVLLDLLGRKASVLIASDGIN